MYLEEIPMENDPKMSRAYLWNRMHKIPAQELQETYKDLAKRAALSGEEHNQVFEIDGEEVIVPTRAMHDFITEQKVRAEKVAKAMQYMRGQQPFSSLRSNLGTDMAPKDAEDKDENFGDNDSGYYWDSNYNYEYMNPESEKRRVLGKVKP